MYKCNMVKLNIRSILAVRTVIYESIKEVETKLTDNQFHFLTYINTDYLTPVKFSEEMLTVVTLLYMIYTTSSSHSWTRIQNYNEYQKGIKMCVLVFAMIFLRNIDNAI